MKESEKEPEVIRPKFEIRRQTYEEQIQALQRAKYIQNGYMELWKARALYILCTIGILLAVSIAIRIILAIFVPGFTLVSTVAK